VFSNQINAQNLSTVDKPIEIRIDPFSAKLDEPASDYFSSVKYLPLQTTKESAFEEISQMEVTSKHYIIWDEISNCILFFNKSGRFVYKITNKDKSNDKPFKKIGGFAVNESKNELVFDDVHSRYMYIYTLQGKFIKVSEKPKYNGSSFSSLGNIYVYFENYHAEETREINKTPYNLILEKDNKELAFFLPYDTTALNYTDLYSVDQAFYNSQHGFLNFSHTYDYNIYTIDSSAHVNNSYRFVLPAINTVPDDFLTNAKYKNNRMEYTKSNDMVIYSITDFYRIKDEVVFRLFGHATNEIYTYNLSTNDLRSLSNAKPDNLTNMLPFAQQRIYALDKNGDVISALPAAVLFDRKDKLSLNKSWKNSLPEGLKTFFQSDNQQNPVLTIISLKQK